MMVLFCVGRVVGVVLKPGSLLECSSLADLMDRVMFDETKLVLYGEANGIFRQRCLCGCRF